MVHKKYPESILGPWGQTSLDIGIFSISFGMLVVGQDNFLFSCLEWVLQHPNCNPCAEATTRGPASVFTGTMWGAGLLHCHPNHSKHVHERSGFSCTSLLPSSKLGTGDFCSPFWRSRLVLSKTTPLGEGPWDGGASCGHFFPVLTAIAVWRFRRFNLFLLFSLLSFYY